MMSTITFKLNLYLEKKKGVDWTNWKFEIVWGGGDLNQTIIFLAGY